MKLKPLTRWKIKRCSICNKVILKGFLCDSCKKPFTYQRVCKRCEILFEALSNNVKYCPDCNKQKGNLKLNKYPCSH